MPGRAEVRFWFWGKGLEEGSRADTFPGENEGRKWAHGLKGDLGHR